MILLPLHLRAADQHQSVLFTDADSLLIHHGLSDWPSGKDVTWHKVKSSCDPHYRVLIDSWIRSSSGHHVNHHLISKVVSRIWSHVITLSSDKIVSWTRGEDVNILTDYSVCTLITKSFQEKLRWCSVEHVYQAVKC